MSIVIPFYNEERRLRAQLTPAIDRLPQIISGILEVLLVDDGSTDRTLAMLEAETARHRAFAVEVLTYPRNQGKGYAVKRGVERARGDMILVMDADFSIDVAESTRFLDQLAEHDIVIGTKKHFLTQSLRPQKAPRRILGKGFTVLTNLVLGLSFTDITCGFKAFRAAAAKDVFGRQLMKRWAYDAETLFLAKKLGYSTVEVPVRWTHVEGSKVSPIADAFRSLRDLLRIRWSYHAGRYGA